MLGRTERHVPRSVPALDRTALLAALLLSACGANGSNNGSGSTSATPGASTPGGTTGGTTAPGSGSTASPSGTQSSMPGLGGGTNPGASAGSGTQAGSGAMGAAGAGGGSNMMVSGMSGGGAAGAGMQPTGAAGAAGGAPSPADCMKGTTKPSQVIMIGDSYLALSGDITRVLEMDASSAGALPSGQHYRTYYVSGTSLGNGQIPSQFDQALMDPAVQNPSDIKYVLMDGGGNDILLLNPMCQSLADPTTNASCVKSVTDSANAGKALLAKMGASGVKEVVWFFYPNLNPGLLTGTMPQNILNYGYPIMQNVCESATAVKCHFIDTRAAFMGHLSEYIGVDGVHPTLAGSTVIANMIWDVMKANCIAQ